MVALEEVHRSNAQIKTELPPLVAVFVGATSGIGETSLRQFAANAPKCRVYFVGRSQEAGDRIAAECRALNPDGQFTFMQADVSLLRKVDEVCAEIKKKESYVNVLFLCQGTVKFRTKTAEGLHYAMAVTYYGRFRFVVNLLPELQAAPGLRRVATVLAGGKEGEVFPDDWDAWRVPLPKGRGHLCSMTTMYLQTLAEKAPSVSFIHIFPGSVKTNLIRGDEGALFVVLKYWFKIAGLWAWRLGLEECGDRHVYACTSARYPASGSAGAGTSGVPMIAEAGNNAPSSGVDGKSGSGVYTTDWDGSSAAGAEVVGLLDKYGRDGLREKLCEHTEEQFVTITGKSSL